MCGIVGYIGEGNAKEIVLRGLHRLEYRGYDSAGVGLYDGKYHVFKEKGRIDALEKTIALNKASLGIGHTRWATHGRVTKENAHPHASYDERFLVVHNGVIDNYKTLAERYLGGKARKSETDSEVFASLVASFAKDHPVDVAIREVLKLLEGSYAVLVVDKENPGTLYAAKHKSPLLIGKRNGGVVIGSDMMALVGAADNYLALEDETFVRITSDNFSLYDLEGDILPYRLQKIDIDAFESDKGEFPHYMLKEIHEQPAVLRRIITKYFDDSEVRIDQALLQKIKMCDRIHILAAGTSMHAGLVVKDMLETFALVPTEVHIASEFAHHPPLIAGNPFFILISQSGETADLRACLTDIKQEGHPSLTVTNVRTSTLAREADDYLEIHAGPEIAVASTKAYTAQIAVLTILAYALSEQSFDLKRELAEVAQAMEQFLDKQEKIRPLVKKYLTKPHAFYIGRGLDYAVCLEAALKLKEISYIHTEGFASGELKHGTIALIEENTPVIALISNAKTAAYTRSGINEVKSRGANTLVIACESFQEAEDAIVLDDVNPTFAPMLTVIPTQLIAYYAALERGNDIDKPRNLAKSVTVE